MPLQPVNTEPNASTHGEAVTPSNTVDLTSLTKGLFVVGAGDLKVTFAEDADDAPVTLLAVAAGSYLDFSVKRVWATGTTATGIYALWE